MRKTIMAAVAVASLVVPTVAMANASGKTASSGANAGVAENGWVGTQQRNGTVTTQYSATYSDPVFGGPLTCNGVHQEKKSGTIQDSFTCSLNASGNWASAPYVGQTVSWNSDYYGVKDPNATHNGSMTITSVGHDSNGHVTSYTGLATYTS